MLYQMKPDRLHFHTRKCLYLSRQPQSHSSFLSIKPALPAKEKILPGSEKNDSPVIEQ